MSVQSKPVRIQRKRTKGWKMPPNTVYVGRPGKYGNPFKIGGYYLMGDKYPDGIRFFPGASVIYMEAANKADADSRYESPKTIDECISMHKRYLALKPQRSIDAIKKDLRDKNLACWCKLGTPCHADILLEIANT